MPRDAAVRELQSYLATQEGFDVADLPVGMYYAHILSGYNTHLVNTIDTALNVVAEVGELAALEPKAASAVYGGLLRGLSEGRFEALAALTRGRLITRERWMDPGKLGEQSTLLRPPMQEPPRPRLFEVARFGENGGVSLKTETVTGRVLKAAAESKIAYPLRAYKYVPRLLTASDALARVDCTVRPRKGGAR